MATTLEQRLEQAKNIRDNLLNVLEGRSTQNHDSYSIGDRSISKLSITEARVEYDKWEGIVRKLEKENKMTKGGFGGMRVRG